MTLNRTLLTRPSQRDTVTYMAFVKLDTEMLDSTIWMDRPAREIFITSLLLASPKEFSEAQKQIEVGALEYTGWEAPPGWYGYVPASGPGIIHRAQVPEEEGREALKRLGSPEPESRSQAFGGRRMVRIDGGFLILNYMKYRDKDHTSPVRSARYRARLKEAASHRDVLDNTPRHAVTSHTRDMPYASDLSSLKSEKSKSRAKPKLPMPDGFAPDQVAIALASERGVDLKSELPQFVDHHLKLGNAFVSWQAALRTWIRRSKPTLKQKAKTMADVVKGDSW